MKNLILISLLTIFPITNINASNYVSESYLKKDMGYDWVSVSLKDIDAHNAKISIKSRADRKKPTCTFDDVVSKSSNNEYISYKEGKKIIFTLKDDTLSIKGENVEDENILFYFCSGGGSLKGEYKRLYEPLDKKQIDKRNYANTLYYNQYMFFIEESNNTISIFSPNLKYSNKPILKKIDGEIIYSEIADMNSDGNPEIYIYTNSLKDKRNYAELTAFSVNNGVSLSEIYLESLSENKKALENFEGNDEFRVVETTLVRRFPIKGNKTKQIQYKLISGEASWQLKVDKILEY
jgi:hypothetical protein